MAAVRPIYAFDKFPNEEFAQSVDFADSLDLVETVAAGAASAVDRNTGADATADVIDGAASVNGTSVVYAVKGGSPGARYMLSIRATASSGNVYEQWIEMRIPAEVL